jgi:hypothetical protein
LRGPFGNEGQEQRDQAVRVGIPSGWDRYRPGLGQPQVYSGANNFWLWGPPPAADTATIAVNPDPAFLHREFRHVRLAATFWNGLGVRDDEQGVRVS